MERSSNMNTSARKGNEMASAQGPVESKVDTVDYRTPVGQHQEQRPVQVVHQLHPKEESSTGGGVLAEAAAAVTNTLQAAKDALSGK
ncbi:uncharacterized protein LOC131163637 [Malania oleifera]|uniref:uncharacterized protein LOC131163637 n=1 Tax=Malania oleifera TaxID=397392 RepID=UPI0025AE1F6E|nr:uncharacterized protein LOC131163637 [Malania oleifera]